MTKKADIMKNACSGMIIGLAVFLLALILLGNRIYVIRSGSMEPVIQTGAAAVVNLRAKFTEIKKGEIICFSSVNNADVIHRVNEVRADGIVTKGDANNVSDGVLVTEENFKGKVVFSIPYAGYVLSTISSAKGRILILTAAGVIIVLSLFGQKGSEIRRQDVQKNSN